MKKIKRNIATLKSENLGRLIGSGILEDFIKETRGLWDNNAWRNLCDKIKKKGYMPIDITEVGVYLEKVKAAYHDDR